MLTSHHRALRFLVTAILAFTTASTTACDDRTPGDPDALPTPANVVGNYNLLKVDSAPLPFVIFSYSTYTVSLTEAHIELKSNGTYRSPVSIRIDDTGNVRYVSDSTVGTWTLVGDSIRLANASGQVTRAGRMLSGTFRLKSGDQVWELRK